MSLAAALRDQIAMRNICDRSLREIWRAIQLATDSTDYQAKKLLKVLVDTERMIKRSRVECDTNILLMQEALTNPKGQPLPRNRPRRRPAAKGVKS